MTTRQYQRVDCGSMSSEPHLAIVLVHYFTPELVAQAVAHLKEDLRGSGLKVEWLLADNGSRPQDREAFEALGLRYIEPGAHTGYAGGVNRGVAASTAPMLVIMNPDVLVLPGCLAALLAELRKGADVAGPRFYWDRQRRLLLPPNEPRRRPWELAASLGRRFPLAATRARRAWRSHVRRHWLAPGAFPTFELSGALLAFHRRAWEKVGPFDEAYDLYFEETDWLHRLRRAGGSGAYVNGAEAIHLYNRSAAHEPRAAAWLAASRQRFQRTHYGRWFAHLISLIEGSSKAPSVTGPSLPEPPVPELSLPKAFPVWVEISPSPMGFPAAAEWLDVNRQESWEPPSAIVADLAPGPYWIRLVTEEGEELSVHRRELEVGRS